jgi:hypothetical protein
MPRIRYTKVRRYAADGTLLEERNEPVEVEDEQLTEEDLWRRLRQAVQNDQTRRAVRLMYRILRRHLSGEGDDPAVDPDQPA